MRVTEANSEALDFIQNANVAIEVVNQNPDVFPMLIGVDLKGLLSSSSINVVDRPLTVTLKDSTPSQQPCVAVNSRFPNTIWVNEDQWENLLYKPVLKQEIALHELLGLAGMESTGIYTVSEKYLELTTNDMDISDGSQSLSLNWSYPKIESLFTSSITSTSLIDLGGNWKGFYKVDNPSLKGDGAPLLVPQTISVEIANSSSTSDTATLSLEQIINPLAPIERQSKISVSTSDDPSSEVGFDYFDISAQQTRTLECREYLNPDDPSTNEPMWILICKKKTKSGNALSYLLYEQY